MLHEPCYLGRHNGEYEAPRAILAALCKDTPLEFPLARERSIGCGAGGGRMWLDERIGTKINGERVRQALPQDPAVIASACPYCAVMLGDALKVQDLSERIASKDLAELVAEALA
jgi:Fe-S oxidoreductase